MSRSLDKKVKLIVWLCVVLIGIHLINVFTGGVITRLGIYPGRIESLPYIFTAPFIHGSWMHLLNNLFGLCVFSALCLLRGLSFYIKSSVFVIVFSGLLVWLVGRPAVHIGASGWIFGLWSLSIALAFFQRSFSSIAIAVFVAVFYGGMVWGVLPGRTHISFESHLFGAIGGVLWAYINRRKR